MKMLVELRLSKVDGLGAGVCERCGKSVGCTIACTVHYADWKCPENGIVEICKNCHKELTQESGILSQTPSREEETGGET